MTSAVTRSITHVCDTTNSCITSSKISPSKARLATQRPRTSLFPCETGLDSPPSTHGNESFCNALSVVTRHCSLNNVQWRCPWCSINEGFALLVSTSKKYSVLHSERTQAPSMWTRTSCSACVAQKFAHPASSVLLSKSRIQSRVLGWRLGRAWSLPALALVELRILSGRSSTWQFLLGRS